MVAFDVVGPSATGAVSATSPLSWTHTASAGATVAVVGVTVDAGSDVGLTLSVTFGGQAMTSIRRWESGGSAQSVGFLQVFKLSSPPTGARTVVATVAGGPPASVSGGSMTFTSAGPVSVDVHGDSNATSVTSGSIAVPTTSATSVAACFMTDGAGGIAWTAGTSRYNNVSIAITGAAAAYTSAATLPGTGSNVTFSWNQNGDYYAVIGVEVQDAGGAVGILPQQTKHRFPATFTRIAGKHRSAVYR